MSEYSLSTSISNSNASLNSSSTSATNSNASLTFSLLHQQLIRIVSSSQPIIPMKDTFYLTLGKERFPFAMDREMEFQILERAQESMREPIGNQIVISNVNDLITRFCNLLNRYTFQKDPSIEILNLSIYLSIFCRQLLSQSDGHAENSFPDEKIVTQLFQHLCKVIVQLPIKTEDTLQLVIESLRLLVILLSEQIFFSKISSQFYLHSIFSNSSVSLSPLFFRLLQLARLQKDTELSNTFSLTSAILHPISTLFYPKPLHFEFLSKLSLDLVALLSVQKENLPLLSVFLKKWSEYLQSSPSISYAYILDTVIMFLDTISGAILFYELLHRNAEFRNFILSRTDPDFLLLPILKFLYHLFRNVPPLLNKSSSQSNLVTASSLPYSHIYILLVSLVILTLDSSYIETIMSTFIDPLPPWFPNENSDSKMSLGSLLAFVILKLMQININYDRDPFVHANAVAILTNISRFWKHIHLLVAFKFVHWFDSISKRFSKLKELSEDAFFTSNASGLEHTYSNADLVIYTDILTLFLTVFHCALHISFVRFNPYLVCALLNKENVFDEVSEFDEFSDLVFPLIELLEYFKSGISIHSLTSEKLYQHVVYQSKTVGSNYPIQRKMNDLAFEFVEDVNSDAFFIPLMWSIIFKESCAWDRVPRLLYQFENAEIHAMGSVYEFSDLNFELTF
ncbi:hypothetical protein HMI56_004944 [Coelomomyces lativittatus]|nr:hypothetical protein HMI56_004944 [Coelomomyces lativittatus]